MKRSTTSLPPDARLTVTLVNMKRLIYDPERFGILGLIDAIGARHNISIDRTDEILSIITASAASKPSSIMLHGRRVEAMFGYVAAALGKCSLVKKEDCRPVFAKRADTKIPDYRLVTDESAQILVEVKNCHKKRLDSTFSIRSRDFDGFQAYASLVRTELRFAIYWSRWRMWTLVEPSDLCLNGSTWTTSLEECMKQNQMAMLGDVTLGTTPPLVCRLLTDPKQLPTIGPNGQVEFTVHRVEMECAGRRITKTSEQNIAFRFMLCGEWPDRQRALVEDGKLLGVEFVSEPTGRVPRQGFEVIGTLSRMASRQFDELTAPTGAIRRLEPNVKDPESWIPSIADSYAGQDLPLWIFRQEPNKKRKDRSRG